MEYKYRIVLIFLVIFLSCRIEVCKSLEKEILPSPDDRVFNHAPSMLELPDGTFLVAWSSGSKEKSKDSAIVLSFQKPGAKEWSPTPASPRGERGESTGRRTGWSQPQILVDTPNRADGNPVLFIFDNEIYCFYSSLWGTGWSTARLFYTKSKLNGINFSWTSPKRVFPFYRMGDLARGKPIVLNDKEFILPLYKEFIGYYSYICQFEDEKIIYSSSLIRSNPGNLQPAIIPMTNGELFMLMRPEKSGYFWQSFSIDKGKIWSNPKQRKDLLNPCSGFDLLKLKSGKIALIFNENSKNRNNLTIALSEDEGESFSMRKILEEEKNMDFAYPSVIQDSKGKIHIVYSVNKKEIRHIILNEEEISDRAKTKD